MKLKSRFQTDAGKNISFEKECLALQKRFPDKITKSCGAVSENIFMERITLYLPTGIDFQGLPFIARLKCVIFGIKNDRLFFSG